MLLCITFLVDGATSNTTPNAHDGSQAPITAKHASSKQASPTAQLQGVAELLKVKGSGFVVIVDHEDVLDLTQEFSAGLGVGHVILQPTRLGGGYWAMRACSLPLSV